MPFIFVFLFLLSLDCAASMKVNVKVNAAEILIEDQEFAKKIFRSLNGKIEEFSEVDGIYRHGKYWYCMVDGEFYFSCALYLKDNGIGELSSWEDDPDFGKSGLIEALTAQSVSGTAHVQQNDQGMTFTFTGAIAGQLKRKLFFYPEKGINYSCQESLQHQTCKMKVPWDKRKKENITPVFQDAKA